MKKRKKSLGEVFPEFLFESVHLAIGEATTCWENVEKAGGFKSEHASEIAEKLCWGIHDYFKGSKNE
jgi:hypothetical protein